MSEPSALQAQAPGGNVLRGDEAGEGPAVVQAHGLTAWRKLVTHGSRQIERKGLRAVRYDARGHGESDPAPAGEAYGYDALARDMGAVIDAASPDGRVLIAGHSMGAHTAAAYALANAERVAGLVAIGPATLGEAAGADSIAYWDGLADGLERDGIDGFIAAYDDGTHEPRWRETILRLARQRLEVHEHLDAVADALRSITRSVPFEGPEALERLAVPTLIVASHDDADPGHPYAIAREWDERIPGAWLVSEAEGESPLAWQGGKLSREIVAFANEDAVAARLAG